jgi:hypothetical protein
MKNDNILIAEFMGLEKAPETVTVVNGANMRESWQEVGYLIDGCSYSASGLQYKYNWKWLMPVIEKIESLNLEHEHGSIQISTNIEKTYQSVVNLLKKL